MLYQNNSAQKTTKTISQSFIDFFDRFIDQLPGIGIGLLIIILGVLIASWIGRFSQRKISARTKDPLMSRFFR